MQPSDKALEAVARALAERGHYYGNKEVVVTEQDRKNARAALSALRAAGYAVVPVEPTPEMVERAKAAWVERVRDKTARMAFGEGGPEAPLIANYRAMLEAASPSLGAGEENPQ